MDQVINRWIECIRNSEPVAIATVIERTHDGHGNRPPPAKLGATLLVTRTDVQGTLGHYLLDDVVIRDANAALVSGQSEARHYGSAGEARRNEVTVFIEVFSSPPLMIIFGAVDFTAALVKVAKILGYHVTVCDARQVFATKQRFPDADNVVVSWPDVYLEEVGDQLGPLDAVCVLTHDHKFDVPAIVAALSTKVGYLGAMGSRRTHAERVERLLSAGVDPLRLHEIMSPIGLAIGARSPEETAVAICGEIIARRTKANARFLRDETGPLHSATTG